MKISVRHVALWCALSTAALANDIAVVTSTDSGIYGTLSVPVVVAGIRMPADYAAQFVVPPPLPTSTSSVSVPMASVSVAPTTNSISTSSVGTSTIAVPGSFSSVLSGTLAYGANMSGGSVALSAGAPLVFSGYSAFVGAGHTLTGATLNLDLLIGNPTLGGSDLGWLPSLPQVGSSLANLSITISTGSVSRTLNATSVTAYDLFANGFSADLLAGKPLTITFNGMDSVFVPVNSTSVSTSGQVIIGGIRMPADYWATQAPIVLLTDTRTITSASGSTFLTLHETDPATVAPALADNPEPLTTVLVGGGLLLLGCIRFRRRPTRKS